MKSCYLLLVTLFFLSSCKQKQTLAEKQKEIDNGTIDKQNTYTFEKIGWTIQLPEGWDVLSKADVKKNTEKGLKALEKANNVEVDASGLEQLINIRKDHFNSFLSTIEPYDEKTNGAYEENNKLVYQLMKDTYAGNGIYAEYEEGKELIDGINFNTFSCKIYAPDKSKVILRQKMYSRLLNGYDFSMTSNYNNEADQKTLESMIFTSLFKTKN